MRGCARRRLNVVRSLGAADQDAGSENARSAAVRARCATGRDVRNLRHGHIAEHR